LSPEQIKGGAPDARSDLFSLGAVVYAVAAGRAPFEGPTAMATVRRAAEVSYTPLPDVVVNAPFALSDLVQALLRKDPDTRPSSAREVLDRSRGLDADAARGKELLAKLMAEGSLGPRHLTTTAPHLAPLLAPEVEAPVRPAVVAAPVAVPVAPPVVAPAAVAPPVAGSTWDEGPTTAFEPVHAAVAEARPSPLAPAFAPIAAGPPVVPPATPPIAVPGAPPIGTPPIGHAGPSAPPRPGVSPIAARLTRGRTVDADGFPVWVVPAVFAALFVMILVAVVIAAIAI
jgi:serine/threonine-protein kinase